LKEGVDLGDEPGRVFVGQLVIDGAKGGDLPIGRPGVLYPVFSRRPVTGTAVLPEQLFTVPRVAHELLGGGHLARRLHLLALRLLFLPRPRGRT